MTKRARRSNNPSLPRSGGTPVCGRVSRDLVGFAPIDDNKYVEFIADRFIEVMLTQSMYDLSGSPGFQLPGEDSEMREF